MIHVRYVNWTTHQAVAPAEMAWVSSAPLKKQEVKKIDCCFIPYTQASPYLRLATNLTLYDELSARVRAFSLMATKTNFASFASPRHGGAEGWAGSVGRGCCSALVALRNLYSQWQPYCFQLQLCGQMLFLRKPIPSCCCFPGCGAQQKATVPS